MPLVIPNIHPDLTSHAAALSYLNQGGDLNQQGSLRLPKDMLYPRSPNNDTEKIEFGRSWFGHIHAICPGLGSHHSVKENLQQQAFIEAYEEYGISFIEPYKKACMMQLEHSMELVLKSLKFSKTAKPDHYVNAATPARPELLTKLSDF